MSGPTTPTWGGLLSTLLRGEDLPAEDTAWAMDQVMLGEATPVQIAGLLVALRAKGESPEEVGGLVQAMLAHATRISVPGVTVDTCGTGGDRSHTVNISTMSALVVAACGVTVVKHGNRAASSACGSADLLEALGVAVDLPPDAVVACAEQAGITFCFAPRFHPATRHSLTPRRELGVATVFNVLGPLTNPAQPRHQAVGVADQRMAGVVARVLAGRGSSALVFRGDDALDELTTTTTSRIWWVRGGRVDESVFDPLAVGIPRATAEDLRGADPAFNADVARRFVAGETGPVRDAVLLNAAAALVAVSPTDAPLEEQIGAALGQAAEAVDSGAVAAVLDTWVRTSRMLSGST